jgi:ABC-type phosphate transport system substrate-binding protein
VQSWLRDAEAARFTTAQVAPVYLSQHGYENLAGGNCDLACTDRRLTVRELAQFGDAAPIGRRIAFYGYGLYVNHNNPLDAIFARHLRMVFQKQMTDWGELAGERIPTWRGPINLYGQSKSTRAGMIMAPLAKIWFAEPTWQVLKTDQDVIAAVAADPHGLGFASIGYDNDHVRYLGLRMQRHDAPAFPSIEEIEAERYGLAKLIYVYYVAPATPPVTAALQYLQSDAGRRAIESTDLWVIPPDAAAVTRPAP